MLAAHVFPFLSTSSNQNCLPCPGAECDPDDDECEDSLRCCPEYLECVDDDTWTAWSCGKILNVCRTLHHAACEPCLLVDDVSLVSCVFGLARYNDAMPDNH